MAYEELCMYCFEDRQGQIICPHCGRDSRAAVPQVQMLPGTLVYRERFLVGRALGQDAGGIVYSAYDTKRENKLKLREYLPRDCAERLNDGSVVPIAGLEDQFEKGMRKLRASVEGVEDPKKRHFYFEENGTAYIAQRKSTGGAAPVRERYRDDEDDDRRSGARQLGLIVGGAAVVVVIAVIVIISMVNGALKSADDVIQNPTLAPSASNALWAPAETPTPTPYIAPTFAALVDPEQSWMDYTYEGDVNEDFDHQLGFTSTATPIPTIRPQTTKNPTVNNKSDAAEITKLQQRLAALGWLNATGITGKYDSATKQAVKDFQNYVNTAIKPNPKLDVDGIAGPKTQQWLYGTDTVKPTAAPTPVVTPDPEQQLTVDKNSSKTDIAAVQRKLIVLGLMKAGSDDGVYGTTTEAAVKKFQQRVNQLQGYNALPITGTVDPDTMAYLNYYVEWWEDLQQATATPEPVTPATPSPVPTAAPTEAPTPVPTEIPDKEETGTVVDKNSPKESIAFVQEMLIGVGLLPEGSDDGVYGSGTAQAVQAFQEWVNAQLGFGTVPVTGVADQLTLSYLETAYGEGMSVVPQATEVPAPTEVPTAEPTAEPTAAPTPDPTEIPDQEEDSFAVTPDSPKESIQYVQQMMIEAGLLADGGDDGVYGKGTAAAMKKFQQYVNQTFGAGTVPEDGMGDSLTLSYLEAFVDKGMTMPADPTAAPEATEVPVPTEVPVTPTPEPENTEIPDQEEDDFQVDADSPKESIQYVQQMLIEAGLLGHGSDDGVYGRGTAAAVLEFQQYVNNYFGDSKVPETGVADSVTLSYLEEFISRGMTVPTATEAPAEPTEAPAAAAEVSMKIGGTEIINGVHALTGDRITFQWAANVPSEYYIYVTDGDGNSFYSDEATDNTQGVFGAAELTPGMIYTIEIGALPLNGSEGEMAWTRAQFGVPGTPATATPAPTQSVGVINALNLAVNGESPSGIVQVTGDSVTFQWGAEGDLDYYTVVVESNSGDRLVNWTNTRETKGTLKASQLTPGEVYTISISAVPVNGGKTVWTEARFGVPARAEATEAPEYHPVGMPTITIDGPAYIEDGVQYLTGSSAIFTWMSTGEIKGYMVYMLNSAEERLDFEPTTTTSMTMPLDQLPKDVYRFFVGAVPKDAASEADVIWNSIVFSIAE